MTHILIKPTAKFANKVRKKYTNDKNYYTVKDYCHDTVKYRGAVHSMVI